MVRLIVYNIEYLEGLKGKKTSYLKFWRRVVHPEGIEIKLAKALKKYKPDIVSFVEVGGSSFLEDNYFMYLKKELGMKYHSKRLKYHFKWPYRLLKKVPLLNDQTNGLISKKKIQESDAVYLHSGMKKTVIKVELRVPQKITLLLVHLALGRKTRKKQIDELTEVVNGIEGPVILAGDFNTFEGEKEIKKLLEKAALNHKFGLRGGRVFTYPTYHPRRRFDYVLTSKEVKVKKYQVLNMDFSDHLPILIDFDVKK